MLMVESSELLIMSSLLSLLSTGTIGSTCGDKLLSKYKFVVKLLLSNWLNLSPNGDFHYFEELSCLLYKYYQVLIKYINNVSIIKL